MPIQFNRENVQQLWNTKTAAGAGSAPPLATPKGNSLSQALNDHQLTQQEYQELKSTFLKEQPGGNFDQWLADALDGALDQKQSPSLQSALGDLSKQGNAVSAISFELNSAGSGYTPQVLAHTYTQADWTQAAKAADSNHDGRLDAQEAAGAQLPEHLKQHLTDNRAILTYNDAQQQLSYYPASEQPQLNARYKDLKVTLDVDLQDVDGIGDSSRGDISGTTSGTLNFDWNGPLVDGIRKAIAEESGGWVEADSRWVDDKRKGGPGYVIQARSGVIATRPIVIKSNAAGEMYLESPGFGSSVRLKLGEQGLKKYALPKLREMGLELNIERRDDRIYLTPHRLSVKNIPLNVTAQNGVQDASQGELALNLAGHTRFDSSAKGLIASFSNVPVTGSSQGNGAVAVADQQTDRISGRIEAGLNYDLQNSRLDTEVVLKNTTVALSLDAREMREQLYLPRTLAQQAGDHLQAKLTLNGSYRTVNGQTQAGKAEGFLDVQSEGAQFYGRVKAGIGETRLALSAMGVQHPKLEQQWQVTAQQGTVDLKKATAPGVDLQAITANTKLGIEQVALTVSSERGRFEMTSEGPNPQQSIDLQNTRAQAHVSFVETDASTVQAEATAQSVKLSQNTEGEWQLNVPNVKVKLEAELALSTLQNLLRDFNRDALANLPQSRSQNETQSQLSAAGMNPSQARQAASLLWKPELQHLLKTSDFMDALKQSKHLKVTSKITGSLQLEDRQDSGLKTTASAHINTQVDLKTNAESKAAIVHGEADAQITLQSQEQNTQISTPELTLSAQAQRQDGSQLAQFEARIAELEGQISDKKQSLSSGELSAQLDFSSVLDTEKIEQIQELLTDFKDDLLLRLDKIGINRQQFENILQAFGKNQIEALFQALKPEDVANMSEDLGLSQKQIQQLMGLLREEPFQKVIQNLFAYSELLTDAQADFSIQLKNESGSWSREDQQMLASLHNAHLQMNAQSRIDQGGSDLSLDLTQSQVDYTQTGKDAKLSWGEQQANATGSLQRKHDGIEQESFDLNIMVNGGAGLVERKQGDFRTHISASRAEAQINQTQADGNQASMELNAGFEQVKSKGSSASGEAEIQGIQASARGELTDREHKGAVSGAGALDIEALHLKPKAVTAEGMKIEANAHSTYAFVDTQQSEGDAKLSFATDRLESSEAQGVKMQAGQFEGMAHTRLQRNGQTRAEMSLKAKAGNLTGLHAQNGNVNFEALRTDLEQQIQTPMARGAVTGHFAMEDYHSENKVQQAKAFSIDEATGTLHIKTDHLRKLLSRSKDAQSILETMSKRWNTEGDAPEFFTNDEVTLTLDKGRWAGDASDGNALGNAQTLSAHLNLPDLETRLGSTKLRINLDRLSLDSENKTEVELSGKAEFSPHQPEFDQSIQSLLDRSLKEAGLNLKPEVHFIDGKFEVKIDRWFVDGLVNVDFSGETIEISVDRAKLLHFLNTRNLATRLSESQINHYLLDVKREGNVINLSLNEFSQSLLHRDNLQIQSVTTQKGKLEAEFSYTNTREYNAGYSDRQQQKLDSRLFQTPSGQARNPRVLEDRIEKLSPGALQRVLKSASAPQLEKMLSAVGGDYDNMLRKALKNESQWQDYPVVNRAIMAANLARSNGLFERVDHDEKQLIQKLVNSLKPQERTLFAQSMSQADYQQVMKHLR